MKPLKTVYNLAHRSNATRFSEIGIKGNLMSVLENQFQIVNPTIAQKAFIPAILSGGDLFIRDLTGSGKTFGLALAAVAYPRFIKSSKTKNQLEIHQLPQNGSQMKENDVDDMHRSKITYDEDTIHDQNQFEDLNLDIHQNDMVQLPMAKEIKKNQDRYVHTLIIVPTRDLAVQVFDWIKGFTSSYIHGDDVAYMVQCIISGPQVESQKELLKKYTPRIVVGTPNRLLDLFNSKDLDLSRLRLLIVDEADRIVNVTSSHASVKKRFNAKVHKLDGESLIENLFKSRKKKAGNSKIQVVACSASINSSLRNEFKRKEWVVDPIHVDTTGSLTLPNTLEHKAYVVQKDGLYSFDWSIPQGDSEASSNDTGNHSSILSEATSAAATETSLTGVETNDKVGIDAEIASEQGEGTKPTTLADDDPLVIDSIKYLIDQGNFSSGFIFTSSSISVRKLVANLQSAGVDALRFVDVRDYDEKSQSKNITSEKSLPNWLVLTEHEARGLDLPTASVVFILGPPSSPQSYLHMAGRVGRAGRTGIVISLLGGPKFETKLRSMASILKISPSQNKIK